MTTQTQGKGKKRNKEVIKISLDEFNQNEAPIGHSVVCVKTTGLDWADTMAQQMQTDEAQQIVVPTAPRAQRGPGVDFDSLTNEPPFRVSVFNLPISVDEKDVQGWFQGLDVIRVEMSSKSSTTVELGSKDHLYEALCKDGLNMKGRAVNVCLYGQQPQNNYGSDRYGSRGGNSNYGDRYGDRQGGGFGQRPGDRYGDRSNDRYGDRSGGFGKDRDSYNSASGAGGAGFGRSGGGFGQQRGGYNDRYNDRTSRDNNRGHYTSGGGEPESEEPTNWRTRPTVKPAPPAPPQQSAYNNGSRQPYSHSRPELSQHNYEHTSPAPQQHYHQPEPYYQPRGYQHHNQPSNNSPYNQFNNQANSDNRSLPSSSSEERPKLKLKPRTAPINQDDGSVTRNEAIFGKAKPTSTPYQKMNEVEEKLKAVQIVEKKESKKLD